MTILEIMREYFPDESEDWLEDILWSETGWPSFFQNGIDSLRMQLAVVRAREYNGEFGYFDSDRYMQDLPLLPPPSSAPAE